MSLIENPDFENFACIFEERSTLKINNYGFHKTGVGELAIP